MYLAYADGIKTLNTLLTEAFTNIRTTNSTGLHNILPADYNASHMRLTHLHLPYRTSSTADIPNMSLSSSQLYSSFKYVTGLSAFKVVNTVGASFGVYGAFMSTDNTYNKFNYIDLTTGTMFDYIPLVPLAGSKIAVTIEFYKQL